MAQQYKAIEYICTWCGTKNLRAPTAGRPSPGNCPRRPKTRDGKAAPHVWRINRKV